MNLGGFSQAVHASGLRSARPSMFEPQRRSPLLCWRTDSTIFIVLISKADSVPAAEAGAITLLAAGDERVFSSVTPIFEAIVRQYFYRGASGAGTTMKLVANALGCTFQDGLAQGHSHVQYSARYSRW